MGRKTTGRGQHSNLLDPGKKQETTDITGGRTKQTQPHSDTTGRTHETSQSTDNTPTLKKEMTDPSAGEGWDDADTMELGDSRIDNENPDIIVTDYKQQPGEVDNKPTNRHGKRKRERTCRTYRKGIPTGTLHNRMKPEE